MSKTSQYSKTKIREFYLDLYNPIEFPAAIDDISYVIESKYDQRPDLLAHDQYGSAGYWWIFAVRNKNILIDPINDFTVGTEIMMPARRSTGRFK